MMIRAEITDDERRALKARAAQSGVTLAEYVGAILRDYAIPLDDVTPARRGAFMRDLPNPFDGKDG